MASEIGTCDICDGNTRKVLKFQTHPHAVGGMLHDSVILHICLGCIFDAADREATKDADTSAA